MDTVTRAACEIRDIELLSEMGQLEDLQQEIWNLTEREIVPAAQFCAVREAGGILIGAFDQGRLVGFVYGFLGHEDGHFSIHSDMLGLKSEYRRRGLGYRLKLAQRERALAAGIGRITWTFDPLQAANARLNLYKLGAVARRYLVNLYGAGGNSLLHRFGSDRLWATWLLDSSRVKRRLSQTAFPSGSEPDWEGAVCWVRVGRGGLPETAALTPPPTQKAILIEVPCDFETLSSSRTEGGRLWREATRAAFTRALESGYVVEEFRVHPEAHRPYGQYLLLPRKLSRF